MRLAARSCDRWWTGRLDASGAQRPVTGEAMDAFAITGVAAGGRDDEPEWFRVQGAVGERASRPKLFPRVQVVKRETIADLIAGGRIVYMMRPDGHEAAERVRVRLSEDGTPRIEAVGLDGPAATLEALPRFPFAAQASDGDIERLRAIARGEPDASEAAVDRYISFGWVREDDDGSLAITDIGRDLVRSRFM